MVTVREPIGWLIATSETCGAADATDAAQRAAAAMDDFLKFMAFSPRRLMR
jgi:hypothetical protein